MKKILFLFSSFLLIQCGSFEKESTTNIISKGDLAAIQLQKTNVVKNINQLKAELNQLNQAIGKLNKEQQYLLVTSIELEEKEYKHYVSFQGTLESDKNVLIYPEIPGILKKIHVIEGQQVKKGQLLASISDSGVQDQLEQLKLQLKLAKTTYERQSRLWEKKIGSEIQFLQAETQYLSLKKTIAQIEDQVAKTKIGAPFNGIVDHIITDQGSTLSPGMTAIARIINLNAMKVSAQIPEKHLPNIAAATPVKVHIPVLSKSIDAEIKSVGNFINPNNRSFRIEIALENQSKNLKPNMTVQLDVNDYTNAQALLVTSKNILEDQTGKNYVYKLEAVNGQSSIYKAIKTFIEVGKSSNNHTEVIQGLQPGDQLIENGIRLVEDQQLVKIIQS